MWNWFKGLFGFARPKRIFYRFYDGQSWRRIDPLDAYVFLANHREFKIDSDPMLADKGHVGATNRLIMAFREAFQVKPLENGGLSNSEVFALANDFGNYLTALKKKFNVEQT